MTLAVTTALRPDFDTLSRAASIAAELDAALVPRMSGPLSDTARNANAARLLVTERGRLRLWDAASGATYAHHPNLLPVRARGLAHGSRDLLADALQLLPGMRVLDGTVGFGTEAALIALLLGNTADVTGLEADPALALVTRAGMADAHSLPAPLRDACRRVHIVTADHREYLQNALTDSVDIVYLDPFFEAPLTRSRASVSPLSVFGCTAPLTESTVTQAMRVARVRVVVKRPKDDPLPDAWGMARTVSTHKSRIVYHVWE